MSVKRANYFDNFLDGDNVRDLINHVIFSKPKKEPLDLYNIYISDEIFNRLYSTPRPVSIILTRENRPPIGVHLTNK